MIIFIPLTRPGKREKIMSSLFMTRTISIISALAIAGAAAVLSAPQAAADGLGTNCAGTETSRYSPGLTNQTRTIHASVERHYLLCVGGPLFGTSTASGTATTSCTDLSDPLEQVPTGGTITWSTGQTSSYSGTATREKVNADIVAVTRGTVTAGLFTGYNLLQQSTYPNVDVTACSTPQGLTELRGIVVLVISPLPIP